MQRAMGGGNKSTDSTAKNEVRASKTDDGQTHAHKKNDWCSFVLGVFYSSVFNLQYIVGDMN